MSERHKKFHTIALQSSLFKGRNDWYFCYLKAEKIAHVLSLLAQRSTIPDTSLQKLALYAQQLPSTVVHFAAGSVGGAETLATLFSLLSKIRIAGTQNHLSQENVLILVQELEQVAERLATPRHPSPFLSPTDLAVASPAELQIPLLGANAVPVRLKDIYKGHNKGQSSYAVTKGQSERASLILAYLKTAHKKASIKDIARVVPGYSEKTIQRELAALIEQGLIKKEGERRWSLYTLA